MFMAVINSHSLPAQFTYVGNCDYPDSMELEKPYSFILSNDSLLQELEMTRISNEYIQYSIQISNLKDSSEASSQKFHGIAKWDGCYGALTADNFFYVQNWDYRSKDGSIIISIYGDDPDYVILESNALSKTEMTRK
jgi:hypothetical protein